MRDARLSADAVRFLVAGLLNTGLTLVVFQILLLFLPSNIAYAGSWIAGLMFVATVYPNRVFVGGRRRPFDRALVAGTYLIVFLSGLLLLTQLEKRLSWTPQFGIFVVIGATTVMNFLASRFILRRPG